MRNAVLVTLAAGMAACSKEPQEFEPLQEVGKVQSEADVRRRFETNANTASQIPEINNPKQPFDYRGYLTVKNVKSTLRFKGESGGLWVQGDVTGTGIEASDTEMDIRLSGNTNA